MNSSKFAILSLVLILSFLCIILIGCSDNSDKSVDATEIIINTTNTVTSTETDTWTGAQLAAQKVAEDFIRNSSTFRFDGIEGSLDLSSSEPGFTSSFMSWSFTFKFETSHPGYGDRTGQILDEVITAHYAAVLVDLEKQTVAMATCDDSWDMLRERDLAVYVTGIVISGGDTTPSGGPVDVPRVFIYKILRDRGDYVNVSFTAYPPSLAGDEAGANITLDFYTGEVQVGDEMEACGTLDKETNTVVVAEPGDYIRTYRHQATVMGVVVNIQNVTAMDSHPYPPQRYFYQLLRDDGTFINVIYTYNERVQVGDYMKAVGTYDKNANTVSVTGQNDMLKTYAYREETQG
jgi:hypothetical protein